MVSNLNDWQSVFYNSVGSYVQLINLELAKTIDSEPLSKHIRIAGGFAFKSSSYVSEGIPVIRISDFNDEKIILDNVKFYKESDYLKKYELNTGDIVIALTGGTIAKLGIVQEGIGKLYLNQRVGKFEVLNPDEFEAEYVYWIARSVQSIIKELAWGAAIPNVSPKHIEKLEFPIPIRKTQRGIISFLNDLKNDSLEEKTYFNEVIEEKIISIHQKQVDGGLISTELTHQLELVKQLRQAFLREAVQGKLVPQDPNDEPASVLLEKIKVEKDKWIKEKVIKKPKPIPPILDFEVPFDIPTSWTWCRLGEFAYVTSGSTPKSSAFVSEGIPFLKMYNLREQKIDFGYKQQFIKEEVHNGALKRCRAFPGDLIMNIVGPPLGKLAIIPDSLPECNFNQAAVLIRPAILEMNKYLFWYLSEMSEINEVETKGVAGQNNISVTQAHNMKIALPPLSEQQRIVAKLDELMGYCDELEASIKESQQQNELLLQQVLREALEPASAILS